jgi:LmbE family N-acetylglucosaminyl deacetylase
MDGTEILLLIAHPDDDAIFAGALQRRLGAFRWGVVCVTWAAETPRGRELLAWQALLGTDPGRIAFLEQRDEPGDLDRRRCTLDVGAVRGRLRALALAPRLVITHNDVGEYGHPHHVFAHHVAREVFASCPRLVFGAGKPTRDLAVSCRDKWGEVKRCFASQASVIERFISDEETFLHEGPLHPVGR